MNPIILSLSAFLAIALLVLGYSHFVLLKRISEMRARWKDLLEGVRGDDLERLLDLHFKERQQMLEELSEIRSRLDVLKERSIESKRHVGLVSYDAFQDVTGAQSFSLALFDDSGDGAVISSLVGRSDCRVYCKVLHGGRSDRTLSQEERKAIDMARGTGPKSIVS